MLDPESARFDCLRLAVDLAKERSSICVEGPASVVAFAEAFADFVLGTREADGGDARP